jgi:calcineurin-like phosphoesterase family protein
MSELVSQIKWITADWHFGESRFDLMCRPFNSTTEHDETIIANHNRLVAPGDVVLCVGDVTNKDAPEQLSSVARLHGRKLLVRGNHDRPHSDADLSKYFDVIIADGDGLELTYEGISLFATHYPTQGKFDRFNIVGHVHGAWRFQLNMLNVGVDNFGFAPCAMGRVPGFIDAITNHFDRDVWAAYENVNARYRGQRGVASRYLDD